MGLFFAGSPGCSFLLTAAVMAASSLNSTRFFAGRAGSRSVRVSGAPAGTRTFSGSRSRLARASVASRARLLGEIGESQISLPPGAPGGGGGEVRSAPGTEGASAGGGGIAGGGDMEAASGRAGTAGDPAGTSRTMEAARMLPRLPGPQDPSVAQGVPGIVSRLVPWKRPRRLEGRQRWLARPRLRTEQGADSESVAPDVAEAQELEEQSDSASEAQEDSGSVVSCSCSSLVATYTDRSAALLASAWRMLSPPRPVRPQGAPTGPKSGILLSRPAPCIPEALIIKMVYGRLSPPTTGAVAAAAVVGRGLF